MAYEYFKEFMDDLIDEIDLTKKKLFLLRK